MSRDNFHSSHSLKSQIPLQSIIKCGEVFGIEGQAIPDNQPLVSQIVGHYKSCFEKSDLAQAFLSPRELRSIAPEFELGYCSGELSTWLAQRYHDTQGTNLLKQELRTSGLLLAQCPPKEKFAGCLIVPLCDEAGKLVHIYGYRIHKDYHQWQHRWLSRNHQGIFNVKHLQSQPINDVIVCDNIIDALTFWSYGFKNVTATLGSDTFKGFTREIFNFLLSRRVSTVYLAFRNTKANQQAAIKIHQKFHRLAQVLHVTFPKNQGANDFVLNSPSPLDGLSKLVGSATWLREAA